MIAGSSLPFAAPLMEQVAVGAHAFSAAFIDGAAIA
jgi:hypothetical protein